MSKNIEVKGEVKVQVNYWSFESVVSTGFNRLKAKLYNLMELSTLTREQANAAKGLIKGFANDEYRLTLENMRTTAEMMGLKDEREGGSYPALGAEPLETTER